MPKLHVVSPRAGLHALLDEAINEVVPTRSSTRGFKFKPGSMIGRYKILKPIGQGGFGEIWWAEQREPVRRHVALKLVLPGMDTERLLLRFQQERQALAAMEHPNISKLLDAGCSEDGVPFFAMELVREARPLTQYCHEQSLTFNQRVSLFQQVCAGVQHAHQKAIIHRDLKPSNILVAPTGSSGCGIVKIIDFGISKVITADMLDHTQTIEHGQLAGTPEYMAPEQLDSTVAADQRTDVFALGAIFFELIAGHPPLDPRLVKSWSANELLCYLNEHSAPILSQILKARPRSVRETDAKQFGLSSLQLLQMCETDLDWIILKAMARDRTMRYANVEDFAEDLLRSGKDEPIAARPASWHYTISRFARRHKARLRFILLTLLLLIVSNCTSFWWALHAIHSEHQAQTDRLHETSQVLAQVVLLAEQQHTKYPDQTGLLRLLADLRERQAEASEHVGDLTSAKIHLDDALDTRQLLASLPEHTVTDSMQLIASLRARRVIAERLGNSQKQLEDLDKKIADRESELAR